MAAAIARRYGDHFLAVIARRPNESAGDAISVYRLAFRKALSRPRRTSGIVQVFGRRQERGARHAELTGVQKAPRHEVAGSWAPAGQRALWGFDVNADLDGGRNTARKRPGCVDRRGEEPAMGISASARSASAGARRIDRRDRVERDHCRRRASASERESRDAHSRPES